MHLCACNGAIQHKKYNVNIPATADEIADSVQESVLSASHDDSRRLDRGQMRLGLEDAFIVYFLEGKEGFTCRLVEEECDGPKNFH